MLVSKEDMPEVAPQGDTDATEEASFDHDPSSLIDSPDPIARRTWVGEALGKAAGYLLRSTVSGEMITEFKDARAVEHDLDQAPRELSRRRFLQLSGKTVAVAGGIALAEQAYQTAELINQSLTAVYHLEDRLWPENKPTFNFLDGKVPKNPKAIAMFFPGFGDTHAREEAQIVKDQGQIPKGVPVAYFDYSNQGATTKELAAAVLEKIPYKVLEETEITCVDRSLGGPMELGVSTELGVPIKTAIFISSPYTISDGDYGTIGVEASKLSSDRLLTTGTKASVSFWRDATRNRQTNPFRDLGRSFMDLFLASNGIGNPVSDLVDATHDLKRGIDDLRSSSSQAIDDTFSGASSEADRTELLTWDSEHLPTSLSSLSDERLAAFRKVYVPGYTKVLYTATDHPSTDPTVKVSSSAEHYRHFFVDIIGLPAEDFVVVGVPYDGHANTGATMAMEYVRSWLQHNTKATWA